MWYLDFSELVHMTFILFMEMQQFPFEYRAIPCRRIWLSTNKLGESVDLKIKHWKRREGFFPPLCENFRKSCKQRQVWLRCWAILVSWGGWRVYQTSQSEEMFVKQLVNHRRPRSPCWTTRRTRSQNPSCERREPDTVHSLNPIWMISWFHSLPFPLCHFRALTAGCLISSGPRGSADHSLRVPRWGHWDTENVLCRVILIEPLVLRTQPKVTAGKKKSHSTWGRRGLVYKDEQEAKYVAGSFHGFWNIFSSPFDHYSP